MKKEFSNKWISSIQTRKQRKYRYNAPLHTRIKFSGAKLHKTLREKYSIKTLRIVKGDKVKVMRGSYKGKEAIIEKVDRKNNKLILEKIMVSRRDGSDVPLEFEPSNVMIISLNLEDKRRLNNESKSSHKQSTSSRKELKEKNQKGIIR